MRALLPLLLVATSFGLLSCDKNVPADAVAPRAPFITTVSKEYYLSGKEFCERYKSITSKETGKYVKVPKDYNNPSKGNLEIYTYIEGIFDPSKPTYIFLDGGPGQNTHGLMDNYTSGKMNELRFDQRGLGCSAPNTFEEYKDASLYSTSNTIRDLELIREAYGVDKWTVYGVSYGTVPATMYGSKYPEKTVAVVIEGVVGPLEYLNSDEYKASKLNILLQDLNQSQKETFSELIIEKSDIAESFRTALFGQFYQDRGIYAMAALMPQIIRQDGTRNNEILNRIYASIYAHEHIYPMPQQPGAVDETVQQIIYCRDLGYRQSLSKRLEYSLSRGFYAELTSESDRENFCSSIGIPKSKETPYIPKENQIASPIYYFQGSHDGATIAKGAYQHWKIVPKGKSNFFLAKKGGHNPNLSRLENSNKIISTAQNLLFVKALMGEAVSKTDIDVINKNIGFDESWIYYSSFPEETTVLDNELDGIKRNVAR